MKTNNQTTFSSNDTKLTSNAYGNNNKLADMTLIELQEIAIKQLSISSNNVTDVAFLTGFSDISVFSRNFKKWTGLTPTEFQNQQ